MHNAASIPIELGGGNHGFLGLIVMLQKYTTLTGYIFTPHINPGTFSTFSTFSQNLTQLIIAQIAATHEEVLRVWHLQ